MPKNKTVRHFNELAGRYRFTRGLYIAFISFLVGLFLVPASSHAQSFLQQWNASADSPIFTQYAADPSRSHSTIDQAYSLEFYEPDHGIVFGSQKGGHLSLTFELSNRQGVRSNTKYFLEDMNSAPRIGTSYSNFVSYTYKPYRYLEVQSEFYVSSSQFAIQKVRLTNTLSDQISVDVYPIFQHQSGIRDVSIGSDTTYFTFKHDEQLDGWGKRKDLPYPDSLYNVFMVSAEPKSFGAYPALGPLYDEPTLPKTRLADSSLKEGGPVYLQDGNLCMESQPNARMHAFLNGNRASMLTQKTPRINGDTLNISGNGYQQLELTRFTNASVQAGDSFTLQFMCQQQQGGVTATIPEGTDSVGVELNLSVDDYVVPPDSVTLDVGTGYETISLTWQTRPGYAYDIYRGLSSRPGRFQKIADSLTGNSYFDLGVDKFKSQTYVMVAQDSLGNYSVHSPQVQKPLPPPPPNPSNPFFYHVTDSTNLSNSIYPYLKSVVGFQNRIQISAGESVTLKIVRGKGMPVADSLSAMVSKARQLMDTDFDQVESSRSSDYSTIPSVDVGEDQRMVYWSAYNQLLNGVMPDEGQLNHPYLIDTRDASASWRGAGQSATTSLGLLSLVKMDGALAQQVQRNFFEHQQSDGYLPHRLGPYVTDREPMNNENTAAAPWFNWINWNIYLDTGDQQFLSDAYESGRDFYNFWINQRDQDGDGLSEWGGNGALESTREGQSVIWNAVAAPSAVEGLDLNVMLVKEAKSLARMADALGDTAAGNQWRAKAETRAQKVRDLFWDETDGFFYHIDRTDDDFSVHSSQDLKRQEIIGFLPLWAGIATQDQADQLISHLNNVQKFWKPNGVPSLSAADSYYRSIGRWNGPVWISWQYFIYRGLKNYDRDQLASELVEHVSQAAADKLRDIHSFRSRYSPDSDWAGSFNSSTSSSVIARMIWEGQGGSTPIVEDPERQTPHKYNLRQNYPNPFNPTTTIAYSLPRAADVTLTVYTVTGRKVATVVNKRQQAGQYNIQFDGNSLSSGVYMYRLETPNFQETRKMMLIK